MDLTLYTSHRGQEAIGIYNTSEYYFFFLKAGDTSWTEAICTIMYLNICSCLWCSLVQVSLLPNKIKQTWMNEWIRIPPCSLNQAFKLLFFISFSQQLLEEVSYLDISYFNQSTSPRIHSGVLCVPGDLFPTFLLFISFPFINSINIKESFLLPCDF